jgi:hypothetical protein
MVFAVSSTLLGADPVIGVVTAQGSFRVANTSVNDNATLFDGNTIVTGDTTPLVNLKDGARIQLGTGTSASISGHVVNLTQGIGELRSAANYSVLAKTLRITPGKSAIATVKVESDHRVLVAAVAAPVNVYNRNQILVATLRAGDTLSFDPNAASPQATSVTGCLLTKGGSPIVVDPQTYQVSQLVGGNWRAEVGNRVTVTGDVAGTGKTVDIAAQALQVASVTRVAAGGCAAVCADPRIKADSCAVTKIEPRHNPHTTAWVVGGVAVAAVAAIAIYEATKNRS